MFNRQKPIKFRHTLAAIPAVIFWVVSFMFFIMGLSLDDATGYMLWIAFGLAFANTVIQLIGWDSRPEELGFILTCSWYASYILGIGTNMVSLINILQIQNTFLEWMVAGSLSFLIEVTPERMFVLAWRSLFPKPGYNGMSPHQGQDDRRTKQRETPEQRAARHDRERAQKQAQQQAALRNQQAAQKHQQAHPFHQPQQQQGQTQQAQARPFKQPANQTQARERGYVQPGMFDPNDPDLEVFDPDELT